MKSRDTFSSCHPTVNFLYFGLVLLFTMCFDHPLTRFVSLAGALCYDLYGRRYAVFSFVRFFCVGSYTALRHHKNTFL